LGEDFCADRVAEIKKLLSPSGFFTLIGIPGVGISFFIRFIATREFAHFIYLDTSALASKTKHEFFVALLKELGIVKIPEGEQELLEAAKKRLKKLTKQKHVIFLFNRFDDLGKEMTDTLLANLRTLRHVTADKISMIFVAHKSLTDVSEDALQGGNMDMFSNIYYFQPYKKEDLRQLFILHSQHLLQQDKAFEEVYEKSGGHYELAKLLLKSKDNKVVAQKFINFSLKKIYTGLSYGQKKILQKIAFSKQIKELDEVLVSLGFIRPNNEFFSPLLAEYIKKTIAIKLPVKEAKLFQLLRKRIDKVVNKEEIFKALWQESDEEFGSDWALNSLIYRLRKNPAFRAKGYVIENHKKVGYILYKN